MLAIVNIYLLLIDEYFNYFHSVSQAVRQSAPTTNHVKNTHLTKYFDQNNESRHSNQAQLLVYHILFKENRHWCSLKCWNTVLHEAWTNMVIDAFFSRQSVDDCFGGGWPEAHNRK